VGAEPLAPAPSAPAPARHSRPSGAAPSADARERQIAILTEAVAALRQEIARGYTHSQELLEETKRLRIQVRTLREELDRSRAENQQLRAQVRTLERRLGEIRVTPPVAAGTGSAQ
jgi:septal ring factor EnvC (AmiA/AmiB activator)